MHIESGLSIEEWKILRNEIIVRYRQRCYRCDKHFSKSKLSVHHIMARANGGSNDPSNLIPLCIPCHDYVEINDLKTLAEIAGSYEMPGVEVRQKPDNQHEEGFTRPDWHKFVYGGTRKH